MVCRKKVLIFQTDVMTPMGDSLHEGSREIKEESQVVPRFLMSGEVELFELGNALVTDKSFYVCDRSFPLQSISDVEVIYHQRSWMPVVAPLFAALSFELAAVFMHKSSLYLGVVGFMLVAAATFWKGGLRYTIALDTAMGYIRAMTSSDRVMVESLQQVLGKAVERAHQRSSSIVSEAPVFRIMPGKGQRTAPSAENGVVAGRPALVAKKPSQSVRPEQTRPYMVAGNTLRKLAVAGSSH